MRRARSAWLGGASWRRTPGFGRCTGGGNDLAFVARAGVGRARAGGGGAGPGATAAGGRPRGTLAVGAARGAFSWEQYGHVTHP